MNFYPKRRRKPEVIIVSLIDIFAILLIFMAMTTQFKEDQPSVTIKLPEAKSAVVAEKTPAKTVVLSISENEELFLDSKPLALDGLKPAILDLMQQQPPPVLALNADKKAPFGIVIAVLVLGGGLALVVSHLEAPPDPEHAARPGWAADAGRDQAGRWAELVVGRARLRLRHIEPGTFTMGSPAEEAGRGADETAHPVTISRAFWLAEAECSQELYQEVTGTNPSRFVNLDLPVDRVSWHEAIAFCDLLSRRVDGLHARLPSEAEWEYACRAGTAGPFAGTALELLGWSAPAGLHGQWESHLRTGEPTVADIEDWIEEHLRDPGMGPQPPLSRRPNGWGLYDMHGNLAEWCRDAWQPGLDHPPEPVTDPVGEAGLGRAMRGGDRKSVV